MKSGSLSLFALAAFLAVAVSAAAWHDAYADPAAVLGAAFGGDTVAIPQINHHCGPPSPSPPPSSSSILQSAITRNTTTVDLCFTINVNAGSIDNTDFTVNGDAVNAVRNTSNSATLTMPTGSAFLPSATPTIAFAANSDGVQDLTRTITYKEGSIVAADGIAPILDIARVTGPNEITIPYSEPVTATLSDYANLTVRNDGSTYFSRNIMNVSGSGTATHIVTFFGSPAVTDAVARIAISGDIADMSGNKLSNAPSTNEQYPVSDGQAPVVESIQVTGPSEVTVTWSEVVTTSSADYVHLRIDGTGWNVTGVSGADSTSVNLVFAGNVANVAATGVLNINSVSDRAMPPNMSEPIHNRVATDGQPPSFKPGTPRAPLTGLDVTGPNEITLVSDEPVYATTSTFSMLHVDPDGTGPVPAAPRGIDRVVGSGTNTLTITFDGDEVGTAATATVDIADEGDNKLRDTSDNLHTNARSNVNVADGQVPRLVSLGIVSGSTVEAVFSEAVILSDTDFTDGSNDFGPLYLTGERSSRNITNITGSDTTTLTISFETDLNNSPTDNTDDDTPAPVNASGTMAINDTLLDLAYNPIQRLGAAHVAAAQAPTVESILITDGNEIRAKFSEDVDIESSYFADLRLAGELIPRNIIYPPVLDDSDPSVVIITFDITGLDRKPNTPDDTPAPTGATATIDIGGVKDLADPQNTIISLNDTRVGDGQAPDVDMYVTGPNQITAEFSEPVHAQADDFDNLRLGPLGSSNPCGTQVLEPRTISGFGGSGTTYVMTFDGAPVPTDAEGQINIPGRITDRSPQNNPYAGLRVDNLQEHCDAGRTQNNPSAVSTDGSGEFVIGIFDGQAPQLESITITGPNELTAVFSEQVRPTASGFTEFRLLPNDFRNITIPPPPPHPASPYSSVMIMGFDGDPAPIDATGLINVNTSIRDILHNAFVRVLNYPVGANQIPSVVSANITSPDEITVVFSEAVVVDDRGPVFDNFGDLRLAGETDPRNITGVGGNRSDTVTVTFDTATNSANPVRTDATATMDIAGVTDQNFHTNVMVPLDDVRVGDGQSPTLRISVTGPNQITAEFSEQVNASPEDFDNLVLSRDDSREITGIERSGTTAFAITFGGSAVPADASGTIDVSGRITDLSQQSNPYVGSDGTPGQTALPVRDGQPPTVLRAEFINGPALMIIYSEPVLSPAQSYTRLILGSGDLRNLSGAFITQGTQVVLNYDGGQVASGETGTMSVDDNIIDRSGNPLATNTIPVHAMAAPVLLSAAITDGNEVTIMFSEPVDVRAQGSTVTAFRGLELTPGGPRNITGIGGDRTDTITITFDGEPAPAGTAGQIDINSVFDLVGNYFWRINGHPLEPAQIPLLDSAAVTGPNEITLTFSEAVTTSLDDFADLRLLPGGTRPITGIAGSGTTVIVLTFGGAPVSTDARATIDIGNGIRDADGNQFAGANDYDIVAAQAPILISVSISSDSRTDTSRAVVGDTVTVSFVASETLAIPVVTFGGTPADSVTNTAGNQWIAARTMQPDDTTGFVVFTIDFQDAGGNRGLQVSAPTDGSSVFFDAALRQTYDSSMVTGPNQVTVAFTEAVTASTSDFTNLQLRPGGGRTVDSVAGSGTDTLVLTFGGAPAPTDATATLDIGELRDPAGSVFSEPLSVEAADGQAPVLDHVSISSSNIRDGFAAAGDTVTLTFTASERIASVRTSINGNDSVPVNPEGNMWNAARTIDDTDPAGTVTFAIDFEDQAQNAGMSVTATTDGSRVSTDACPPGQVTHPYGTACIPPITGEVQVGLLLPEVRESEPRVASEKAVSDFNTWLSSQGRSWTLATQFTDTNFDGATTLNQIKILKEQGTDVIVGVPTSASVNHVKDYVNDNDMVLVSCCSSATSLAVPDNIFRMVPDDSVQAPLLARYIADSGKSAIVTVYRDDTWGNDLKDALGSSFEAAGGTVISAIRYDPATTDFTSIASAISGAVRGEDPDSTAVAFLGWGEAVDLFSAASSDPVLPTITWFGSGVSANEIDIIRDPGALAFATSTGFSAVQFTEQPTGTTDAVKMHIESELMQTPSVYSYSAYDAVWVAGLAIDRAQSRAGADIVSHVIPAAGDRTDGAVGPNALNANGDLVLDSYNIWAVEGDQWVDRGPVPASSSIRGTVFTDTDGNGVQDPGEQGMPGYTMYAIDELRPELQPQTDTTDADGNYSFNVTGHAGRTLVQTGFFPAGHTVEDESSSWFRYVDPAPGQPFEFDVGFYPVPDSEKVTLEITAYEDANGNGVRDSGDPPVGGIEFIVYTYTIGPVPYPQTGADGSATTSGLVPADFVVLVDVDELREAGYAWTATQYTRDDSTEGKAYDPAREVADDPGPGSTHMMDLTLARVS